MIINTTAELAIERQRVWSEAADKLKTSIDRSRILVLVLGIVGAFSATLAGQLINTSVGTSFAWVSAICIGFVPFVTQRFLTRQKVSDWTRARSTSEAIKTELHMFLARASPYTNKEIAGSKMSKRLEKIEAKSRDLLKYTAKIKMASNLSKLYYLPHEYCSKRVKEQASNFYKPKAKFNQKRADVIRLAEITLATIGMLLSILAAIWGGPVELFGNSIITAAWVAVITTIAGALSAHAAASKFEALVISYLATANRLDYLVTKADTNNYVIPSEEWSKFVNECEVVISSQNESWMAEWTNLEEGR